MNCRNCGNMLQPGVMICPFCNTPVNQVMQPPMQPVQPMGQPMVQQPYMMPPKKKNTALYVVLGIVGVIVIAVIAFLIFCKRFTCRGSNGSFTVYYTSSSIIGCTTTGTALCDLDELQETAKLYGVEATIDALKTINAKSGAICSN